MINFIYGTSGSGKSALIEQKIAEDIANGKKVYLIVPEQQAYIAERRYSSLLPPSAQLCFEAVNFTRLANIAQRTLGGLSYNYIDKSTRSLLMWLDITELAPQLCEYGAAASSATRSASLTETMLAAVGELRAAAMTPDKLERIASSLPEASNLRRRLLDISLIWATYQNSVSGGYDELADDLASLAELLRDNDIFSDRHIYIDSFTSFTEQEYNIIDGLMRRCPSLTVTLCCDAPDSSRPHFASVINTARRLSRLAEGRGGYEKTILGESRRHLSPAIAHIERYLWERVQSPEAPVPCSGVEIVSAANPYAEAEAAAARISDALRDGMRCRDISIIVRDTSSWQGIIDAVFDKFSIPYFFSSSTDISTKPLIKLLTSAFAVKNGNWRQADVISLLKTGLCGIEEREVDIFEEYCATWNINGKQFTSGDFTMNPDGYVTELGERGKQILSVANSVRRRTAEPLLRLFTRMDAALDAREMAEAVYSYTEELNVPQTLTSLAERAAASGDRREADELLRLYSVYIDMLDRLADILSASEPDSRLFARAMQIIFDNCAIGSLPTRHDEVSIGSAALFRADHPKMVIVMGLCEGQFPAPVSDGGFFTYSDRALLEQLGIRIECDPSLRSAEEMFYAYRALSAPSETLVLTYSESSCDGTRRRPSEVISRVVELFPDLSVYKYSADAPLSRIYTPELALEYLRSLGEGDEADMLRSLIGEYPDMLALLETLDIPVADADCSLSPETANAILGGRTSISQSRIEGYLNCPFKYYCNYLLGLRESRRADISLADVGTFIHYVMEKFMRSATENGTFSSELDEQSAAALADAIIDSYAKELIPEEDERSSRITFLLLRLRRIALVLIYNIMEEFRHSSFSPAFFEMSVDGRNEVFSKAAEFITNYGNVTLHGVIDRVDLYRRGDDVFVRVIDYKTGDKTYSPEDIAEGMGLQLLLYLFALCHDAPDSFKKALSLPEGGRILPAGAMYLSADIDTVSVERDRGAESVHAEAHKKIKRSGPLLNDGDILSAMNDKLDTAFLGVKLDKPQRGLLLSSEDFDALYDSISATLGQICFEMRSGVASASPRIKGKKSPCNFCAYSDICRSAQPTASKFGD